MPLCGWNLYLTAEWKNKKMYHPGRTLFIMSERAVLISFKSNDTERLRLN